MEVVTTVLTLQIREETGIETEFRSIVAFRHGHNFNFGCSDIYIVVALKPLSEAIHTDQKEIAKCQWMPLQVRSSFIHWPFLILDFSTGLCSSPSRARNKPSLCREVPRIARDWHIHRAHRDRAQNQGLCQTTNHL